MHKGYRFVQFYHKKSYLYFDPATSDARWTRANSSEFLSRLDVNSIYISKNVAYQTRNYSCTVYKKVNMQTNIVQPTDSSTIPVKTDYFAELVMFTSGTTQAIEIRGFSSKLFFAFGPLILFASLFICTYSKEKLFPLAYSS